MAAYSDQIGSDSSGTTTYTWNARNQLVEISGPGVSATFVYDGLGRREKKTINSDVTEFLYDGLNPVQETSGSTVLANILPGLGIDEFLTRTDVVAGVTSGFLADALGSPVAVTDTSGAVQTEYTYEPFGRTTVSGASNSNSYQYTGRENDGTGLYYYRARYYHPQLQRFISQDPFPGFRTIPQSLNGYPYVLNNPQSFIDPDGEFPGPSGAAGGAIAGGIGGAIAGGLSGGVAGAIAGSITGAISGAVSGFITGAAGGGAVGTIVGEIVGGGIGEMLDPTPLSEGDMRPPNPVIKNPPKPQDPFEGQQIQCPPGGCNNDNIGGRKDDWY